MVTRIGTRSIQGMAFGPKVITRALLGEETFFEASSLPPLPPEPVPTDGVEIYLPLADLGITSADEVEVHIPKFKYNKQFALSYDWDDGGSYPTLNLFEYIHGRYCDYGQTYHAGYGDGTGGSDRTTGITPAHPLCFTDGCGREIPFKVGSCATPLSEMLGPERPVPRNAEGHKTSPNIWESEYKLLSDFRQGIINHGYQQTGGDAESLKEWFRHVQDYFSEITPEKGPGYTVAPNRPFYLNRPANNENAYEAMRQIDDLYICQANGYDDAYRNEAGQVFTLENATVQDWINSKRGRGFWSGELTTNELRKAAVTAAYEQREWQEFGSHITDAGSLQDTFIPMFEWIYQTYGAGDPGCATYDTVWFGSSTEIYEYLVMRAGSTLEKRIENGHLVLKVNPYLLPHFKEKDLSLVLRKTGASAGSIPSQVRVKELSTLYYFTHAVQSDGSLLVNLSFDEQRLQLMEKYAQWFEEHQNDRCLSLAQFHYNRLSPSWQAAYTDRLDPDAPFSLKGVVLAHGDAETTGRVVSLTMRYTGRNAPRYYRLSEDPEMTGVEWEEFTSKTLNYTLSAGYEEKTVYCQMKFDDASEPTPSVQASIRLVKPDFALRAKLSFGGDYTDTGFDETWKMNKIHLSATEKDYYAEDGSKMGTVVSLRKTLTASGTYKGVVPGSEVIAKLKYPDYAFAHNLINRGNAAAGPTDDTHAATLLLSVPPGIYTVRLFGNCNPTSAADLRIGHSHYAVSARDSAYEIKEYPFEQPTDYTTNFTEQLSWKAVHCEDGRLYLSWYPTYNASSTPLNVLEIEEYIPGDLFQVTCAASLPDAATVVFTANEQSSLTVENGEPVTVQCTLNDPVNYSVEKWRVYQVHEDGSKVALYDRPASATLTETIASDTHIQALILQDTRPSYPIVSAVEGEGGTLEPLGTNYVKEGESLTFTVSPETGYSLHQLQIDGSVEEGVHDTYTFHNVMAPHTITALFARPKRTAKLNIGGEWNAPGYDATTGVFLGYATQTKRPFTDTTGTEMGTFKLIGKVISYSGYYSGVVPGSEVAEGDKLPYPDYAFLHALVNRGNASSGATDTANTACIELTLPNGTYHVRLFGNCNANAVGDLVTGNCKYAVSADGTTYSVAEYPFQNKLEYTTNFKQQLVWENIQVTDGKLYVAWYPTATNSSTPLNVIEIEAV